MLTFSLQNALSCYNFDKFVIKRCEKGLFYFIKKLFILFYLKGFIYSIKGLLF